MTADADIFAALEDADRMLAQGCTFTDVAVAYTAVGDRFLPDLDAARDWRAVMLRRRIAEAILMAAMTTEQSPANCELLLGKLCDLGFDDLYAKSLTISGYCGYCGQRGDTQRALLRLRPLIAELEDAVTDDEQVLANELQSCKELLARLEGHA